jgi:hypothetical protein
MDTAGRPGQTPIYDQKGSAGHQNRYSAAMATSLAIATHNTLAGDWSTRRISSIPSEAARWNQCFLLGLSVARCSDRLHGRGRAAERQVPAMHTPLQRWGHKRRPALQNKWKALLRERRRSL